MASAVPTFIPEICKHSNYHEQEKLNAKYPMLHLVCEEAQIQALWYELIDSAQKAFGLCTRCQVFYQQFSLDYVRDDIQYTDPNCGRPENLICYFFNTFANLEGFPNTINFIQPGKKGNNPALQICSFLAQSFDFILPLIKRDYQEELCRELAKVLASRVANITEEEMKTLDKDLNQKLRSSIQNLKTITDKFPQRFMFELDFALCIKLIKSQQIGRKLQGLGQLKELQGRVIDECKNKQLFESKTAINISLTQFCDMLHKSGLIQEIFGERAHPECIRRSSPFLQLLASQDQFQLRYVELLWGNCKAKGKHEGVVRATLDTIVEIVPYFNKYNFPEMIFENVRMISNEDLDETYINFIKNFIHKAFTKYEKKQREENAKFMSEVKSLFGMKREPKTTDLPKFFSLNLLYDLMIDRAIIPQNRNKALESMQFILTLPGVPQDLKTDYIRRSISLIKEGRSVIRCNMLLKSIIEKGIGSKYVVEQQRKQEIESILKKEIYPKNLYNILISHLGTLQASTRQKLIDQGHIKPNEDKIFQNLDQLGFDSDGITHEQKLKSFLDLLELLAIISKNHLEFSPENIEKLFSHMYMLRNSEIDQKLFFTMLSKKVQNYYVLQPKGARYFYDRILCDKTKIHPSAFTPQAYYCFKSMFFNINSLEKHFEINSHGCYTLTIRDLRGIQILWEICVGSQNEDIFKQSSQYIIELHYNTLTDKQETNYLFISNCLQLAINSDAGISSYLGQIQSKHSLAMLMKFINLYEGKSEIPPIDESNPALQNGVIQTVQVQMKPDMLQLPIEVNTEETLLSFRSKIATLFDIKINEFNILTKTGIVDTNCDNMAMRCFNVENARTIICERVFISIDENEKPTRILQQNHKMMDNLIQLLNVEDEEIINTIFFILKSMDSQGDQFLVKLKLLQIDPSIQIAQQWFTHFNLSSESPSSIAKFLNSFQLWSTKLPLPVIKAPASQHLLSQKEELTIELQMILQKQGIQFLSELSYVVTQTKKVQIIDLINLNKVLEVILKLINQFKQLKVEKIGLDEKLEIEVFKGIVKLQHVILDNYDYDQEHFFKTFFLGYKYLFSLQERSSPDSLQILFDFMNSDNFISLVNKLMEQDKSKACKVFSHIKLGIAKFNIEEYQQILTEKILGIFFNQILPNSQLDKSPAGIAGMINRTPSQVYEFVAELLKTTQKREHLSDINLEQIMDDLSRRLQLGEMYELSEEDINQQLQGSLILLDSILELIAREQADKGWQNDDLNKLAQFILKKGLFDKGKIDLHQPMKKQDVPEFSVEDDIFETAVEVKREEKQTSSLIYLEKSQDTRIELPLFKTEKCRKTAFDLVKQICQISPESAHLFTTIVSEFMSEPVWRTKKKNDWTLSVGQHKAKSRTGFVGLKNLGSTCYMNSLMQQLFMIPLFRKSIMEVDTRKQIQDEENRKFFDELQALYGSLMESEKQFYNPKMFFCTLKDFDGSQFQMSEQKDVDEFFNHFMERIENCIKGEEQYDSVQTLISGQFANEIISKACPHVSESQENFNTVTLQVKNKKSITSSLSEFVEGEMLEGDNAYYCERCDKKVPALKRQTIKRLPNVLVCVLKRFEFNYEDMQKLKINDYCEFPMELNMKEYTQEYIDKQDLIQEMKEKNIQMEDLSEQQMQIYNLEYPESYYSYRLKGVVIHVGDAERGHYYSFIQERDESESKWYEFDDTNVRPFSEKDLKTEAYGGEEVNAFGQREMRNRNAYMVFYERVNLIETQQLASEVQRRSSVRGVIEDTSPLSHMDKFNLRKIEQQRVVQIPESVHSLTKSQNLRYWKIKNLFSQEFIMFTNEILTHQIQIGTRNPTLQRFALHFFLTIVLRAHNRGILLPPFYKNLKKLLSESDELSEYLIQMFCHKEIVLEFVIECPIQDMRRFVVGLLQEAASTLYIKKSKLINDWFQKINKIETYENKPGYTLLSDGQIQTTTDCFSEIPSLVVFVNLLLSLMQSNDCKHNKPQLSQYYQLLDKLSILGSSIPHYFIQTKSLGVMLQLFNDNRSVEFKDYLESPDIIPIEVTGMPEMGFQNNREEISLQEKQATNLETHPFVFLITVINRVSSQVQLQVIQSENKAKAQISEQEQKFLRTIGVSPSILTPSQESFIKRLILEGQYSKISRNAVGQIIKYICKKNLDLIPEILNILMNGISDSRFSDLKKYTIPLINVLSLPIEAQTSFVSQISLIHEKISDIFDRLLSILQRYVHYFKESDLIIDLIVKIMNKIPVSQEVIRGKDLLVTFIQKFWQRHPHIPVGYSQEMRIFKQGYVNIESLPDNLRITQGMLNDMSELTKQKTLEFQEMIQKKASPEPKSSGASIKQQQPATDVPTNAPSVIATEASTAAQSEVQNHDEENKVIEGIQENQQKQEDEDENKGIEEAKQEGEGEKIEEVKVEEGKQGKEGKSGQEQESTDGGDHDDDDDDDDDSDYDSDDDFYEYDFSEDKELDYLRNATDIISLKRKSVD